jgi:type III pantothenate kinase
VGSPSIDRALTNAARALGIFAPKFIRSARRLGEVTTRYAEPWRLGADRLVAAIGAHAIAGERSCCVADVGTAMTFDVVDERGVHLGGAIVPGPELMISSLLSDTHGIKRRAAGKGAGRRTLFARNTRSAIEAGADYAVAATIDRAVLEARVLLPSAPLVFLTGGAAARVGPLLRTRGVRKVPELVLRGLAELASRTLR